jgi:hypothetical protein
MKRLPLFLLALVFLSCDSNDPDPISVVGLWKFEAGDVSLTMDIFTENPLSGRGEYIDEDGNLIMVLEGTYNEPSITVQFTFLTLTQYVFTGSLLGNTGNQLAGTLRQAGTSNTVDITFQRQ